MILSSFSIILTKQLTIDNAGDPVHETYCTYRHFNIILHLGVVHVRVLVSWTRYEDYKIGTCSVNAASAAVMRFLIK